MKKFNRLFNIKTTRVLINKNWYKVTRISTSRGYLNVKGLLGAFQRGHVERFSNKGEEEK